MCCDWPPKHILNYQNECNLLFVNEECDVTSLSTQKYREKMHNFGHTIAILVDCRILCN